MLLIIAVLFSISFHHGNTYAIKGYIFGDTSGNGEEIVLEPLPNLKFYKFSNTYYYFGTIYKGNFWQSIEFCHYHDMKLLSIESKEENEFIYKTFHKVFNKPIDFHVWSSGTRLADGANYIWLSSGQPVFYTNWHPNQPDNAGNKENCIEVVYNPSYTSLVWNDIDCGALLYVICETSVNKTITNTLSNQNANYNLTYLDSSS